MLATAQLTLEIASRHQRPAVLRMIPVNLRPLTVLDI